jgi:hypothetical protein
MEDAGLTVFERIEQKLSNLGITVNNSDLKEALRQIDARIEANPEDMESRLIRLELKVVELSRFLDSALSALDNGGVSTPAEFIPAEDPAERTITMPSVTGKRPMKRRLNSATGVIEEVEDTGEDNVIVADGRPYGGKRGPGGKEDKKCVFIATTDDEPVPESSKKRK